MAKKAYIVANEQQEYEVLDKLEREGIVWYSDGEKPTKFIPSREEDKSFNLKFPYILFNTLGVVSWGLLENGSSVEIVFDGRKEEQMSDKYVVSKEFMYRLEEWRKNKNLINELVWYTDIKSIPEVVKEWWAEDFVNKTKTNNRLIAIIRWVNGEDIFEIEKPKRWVVRSKETDSKGSHLYVFVSKDDALCYSCLGLVNATHFATKEEAQSWANSHQEVVEVEE